LPDKLGNITVNPPIIEVSAKTTDSVTVKEIQSPIQVTESDREQTKLLQDMVREQKKQTQVLKEGFDPTDTFKSQEVKEIKQENETRSNFDRLSNTIERAQEKSSEAINEQIENMGDKLDKSISTMPIGSGGGVTDLLDGGVDIPGPDIVKNSKKPPRKKGVIRRLFGKAKGLVSNVGRVGAAVPALLKGGAGAAFTGGAASAATAGAAVLAAGAAGYGAGTLINKAVSRATGREDWLLGWIVDRREEKEKRERMVKNYGEWKNKVSPEVLKLMGGKDEFDVMRLLPLRTKGLIEKIDGIWYAKSEADLKKIDEINKATKRAELDMTTMPLHLMDTKPSDITKEDRAKLEALIKRKEILLESFNLDILGQITEGGLEGQIERFMTAYAESEEAYSKAVGKQKEQIKIRMEQSAKAIKELSGMSQYELKELYRKKVAETISKEMEVIVPEFGKEPIPKSTVKSVPEPSEIIPSIELNETEKTENIIQKLKAERIEGLEQDITIAENRRENAKGYFERRKLDLEIGRLEKKKKSIEDMTSKEYRKWLDSAIEDAKERLAQLKQKQRATWVTPGYVKRQLPQIEEQVKSYELERQKLLNLQIKKTTIESKPTNVPTTLANTVKEETKNAAAETRTPRVQTEAKKANQQVIINQQQAQSQPPIRTTRVDDAGVELLRTVISQ
jgi:hypothetical protein